MPADSEFASHCVELMTPLGTPRVRRMFSGHGLYVDEHFVALIIRQVLYLRADATTQAAFERAGSQPFSYATRTGQRVAMAYWSAPDEAMDSPALMLPWARLALDSALRTAAGNRGSSRVDKTAAKTTAKTTPKPASKSAASANDPDQAAPPVRPARKRSR